MQKPKLDQYGNKIICRFCNSNNIVKKGKRKTKTKEKQLYLCKGCFHIFSLDTTAGKRTQPIIILEALTRYSQNYTLEEIQYLILKKYKTKRAVSTIHDWIREFNPEHKKYPPVQIKSFKFNHSGLIYNYKYSLSKIKKAIDYPHLISYLINLPNFIDSKKFSSSKRCSRQNLNLNTNITHYQNNTLNKVTKKALELASSNKQRHNIIENYLLSCSKNTIATEIPIWFWDKHLGSITGHIDIIQVKNNNIHILDYKPNASKENPEKVTTQLNLYAIALSFRTKVPLKNITCAYFDEFDYFAFKPRYKF